jgi:hypothetical protein
VKNE